MHRRLSATAATSRARYGCSDCPFVGACAQKVRAHAAQRHENATIRWLGPSALKPLPNLGRSCALSAAIACAQLVSPASTWPLSPFRQAALTPSVNTAAVLAASCGADLAKDMDLAMALSTVWQGAGLEHHGVQRCCGCPVCGQQTQPAQTLAPYLTLLPAPYSAVDLAKLPLTWKEATKEVCPGTAQQPHAPHAVEAIVCVSCPAKGLILLPRAGHLSTMPDVLSLGPDSARVLGVIAMTRERHVAAFVRYGGSWLSCEPDDGVPLPRVPLPETVVAIIYEKLPREPDSELEEDDDDDGTTPESVPRPLQQLPASVTMAPVTLMVGLSATAAAQERRLLPRRPARTLRVATWNCASAAKRRHCFGPLLDAQPHILGLQETHGRVAEVMADIGADAEFSVLEACRDSGDSTAGGLALLVSRRLGDCELVAPLPPQLGCEAMLLDIVCDDGRRLRVANVYVRPTVASPASLQAFLDGLAEVDPDVVLGDLNAGGSWSAKRTRLGPALEEWLEANDLTLAAAPRRTHIRGSCIDLFLLRAELGGRARTHVAASPLGSDHFPVALDIAADDQPARCRTRRVVAWSRCTAEHWAAFSSFLRQAQYAATADVSRRAKALERTILAAAEQCLEWNVPRSRRYTREEAQADLQAVLRS